MCAAGLQAAAILKAEVYGITRPDWASDQAAVAAAAAKVVVPEFKPKQGVKIETDPKVSRDRPLFAWTVFLNPWNVCGQFWFGRRYL
jgi:ubiquitin-activating enzyme E1